ncbi:MAG: hypothetical protein AAGI24_02195 [Pseudomonadota bacterium]
MLVDIAKNAGQRREIRWLVSSSAAGLLLGLLAVFLFGSQKSQQAALGLGEPWADRELPFEDLMQVLISSDVWGQAPEAVPLEAPPEEPEEDAVALVDRPGVFRHLELVAILRTPGLAAVLQPVKMPESLMSDMVSLPNEAGLYQLNLGDVVAEEWFVSGIADTRLEIANDNSDETVEYRLFAW